MKIKPQHRVGVLSDRFAKNLVHYREGLAWTQEDLAKRLHVTRAYIFYLEKKERAPSLDFIEEAAKIFKVDPSRMVAP